MKTTRETWRTVPSLPEYEASSWGRVRLKTYTASMPNGGTRTYGGVAWYGTWEPIQRRFIFMYNGKTYKVARVVCEAFKGPPPPGQPYCLHRDEDSRNNRPSNLKWGTQKENMNYPGFIAACKARTGVNSTAHKGKLRKMGLI